MGKETLVCVLLVLLQLHAGLAQNGPVLESVCTIEALEELKQEFQREITSLKIEILMNLESMKQCFEGQCECVDHLGDSSRCPAQSCKQIAAQRPQSESGQYWVKACNGCRSKKVYCNFNFPRASGGWMRVANMDMSDSSQQCPHGLRLHSSPKRLCGKTTGGACDSIVYNTHGIAYNKVCGRIKAYPYNSPDVFFRYACQPPCNINQPYLDGISMTHGSPRQHIWSLAASRDSRRCPCTRGSSYLAPSFVGNDYYCEGGSDVRRQATYDAVWDGQACPDVEAPCCQNPNLPWFCKDLPEPTNDDIEVRVCVDQSLSDEDIWVELIELYVQ